MTASTPQFSNSDSAAMGRYQEIETSLPTTAFELSEDWESDFKPHDLADYEALKEHYSGLKLKASPPPFQLQFAVNCVNCGITGTTRKYSVLQIRDLGLPISQDELSDASLTLCFKLYVPIEQVERMGIEKLFRERSAIRVDHSIKTFLEREQVIALTKLLQPIEWELFIGGNWVGYPTVNNDETVRVLLALMDKEKGLDSVIRSKRAASDSDLDPNIPSDTPFYLRG